MMTKQEKYAITPSQLRRLESDEWSMIDGQYVSDMLDHNMVEKEKSFHDGLTIRTKFDSAVGAQSPELIMAGSEEAEVKVGNSNSSADKAQACRIPAVEDHAEDLRKALNATTMPNDEAQDTNAQQEDLIDLVNCSEALEPFPDFESLAPKPRYNMTQHRPKNRFDANEYLHKIKTRFTSQPGIYYAFVGILKAHRAAPSPSPIHQTYDTIRKLFWPHQDLIQGFMEWLPLPINEQNFTFEPVAFESRVYALQQKVWHLEKAGNGGCQTFSQGVNDKFEKIEREMKNLKASVGVLGDENLALRERVRQMDSYLAGPRWVAQQLEKEVEVLKGENEIMKAEIDCIMDE